MDPAPPATKDLSEILRILASTATVPAAASTTPPGASSQSQIPIVASQASAPAAQPRSSPPDPRTITTLPAARRYIARYLSNSAPHLSRISYMRSRQHAMEREWARGRAEILRRVNARPATAQQLNGVLASLGVTLNSNEVDGQQELKEYDLKVMRRAEEMVEAMRREFAQMGVPGFVGVEMEGGEVDRREIVALLEDLAGDEDRAET